MTDRDKLAELMKCYLSFPNEDTDIFEGIAGYLLENGVTIPDENYCSYGERREDD